MEEEIKKLYEIINDSKRIVFFSGAGVSVSSGIPDFRGEHGIYKYAPEEMISHHFFLEHTKEFFDFYLKHLVFLDIILIDILFRIDFFKIFSYAYISSKRNVCVGISLIQFKISIIHPRFSILFIFSWLL